MRRLAEATYGPHCTSASALGDSARPQEPQHIAARRVILEDAQAGPSPLLLRYYHVPSSATAKPGDARSAVAARPHPRRRRHLAALPPSGAGEEARGPGRCRLPGPARDSGRLSLLALAAPETAIGQLEQAFDASIADVVANGVTDEELAGAKRAVEVEHIYESDNTEMLARRIGEAVTIGRSLDDIEAEPARLARVTLQDIRRVAREQLVIQRTVTGIVRRPADTDVAASASRVKSAQGN